MLSFQKKLSNQLVAIRTKRKYSQRQVASRAEFSQAYLAQVELGVRPISWAALRKLEVIYEKSFKRFYAGIGKRGRPKHWVETRAAMRRFATAVRSVWESAAVKAPEHAQPHQVKRDEDPLWTMAIKLGEEAGEEVQRLENLRKNDDFFWRQFNTLRFDSWSEKRLLVRVALLGAQMLGFRLDRLGCTLRTVDGVTGESGVVHRGFAISGKEAGLVWCPQVAVRTRRGFRCVDNLLVMSGGGKSVTLAVELDGAPFHGDLVKERRRDRELGIPVLHVDASRLDEPGLIAKILAWAKARLDAA